VLIQIFGFLRGQRTLAKFNFKRFKCPKDKHFLFAEDVKDGAIEVYCKYCKTTYRITFKNGKIAGLNEIQQKKVEGLDKIKNKG